MPEPLEIPVPGEGEEKMSEEFAALLQQNMSALGQIGLMYLGDIKTVSKAQDYSYQQDKSLVSLSEAVGVREVGSRVTPAGPSPATPVG